MGTKVILRSDITNVGKRGDICDVADGYARNYLLPKGLAIVATDGAVSQAGAGGRLFGSVTANDIVEAVEAQTGVVLDRRKLHLDDAIKVLGTYSVQVKLHSDVEFPVNLEVVG